VAALPEVGFDGRSGRTEGASGAVRGEKANEKRQGLELNDNRVPSV
jgi:hypothetical protein